LLAVALNVLAKIFFYQPLGAAGLALATAVGAWINFLALSAMALARGSMQPDDRLKKVSVSVACASAVLALFALTAVAPINHFIAAWSVPYNREISLCVVGMSGAVMYIGVLILALRLLKVQWRETFTA
jgi:putative peptidoglycan lipid II flippase